MVPRVPAVGFGAVGWALAGLLFVTVLVAFRGGLEGDFVYDDFPRIVDAESRITAIWPPAWIADGQRPVVRLSLVLNHLAGGLDPAGYHAFNLGLHAAAAVLVFLVVFEGGRRLADRGIATDPGRRRLIVAAAAALLWALHPVQTSTATYVIQRAESLAGFFSLLAVYALLRGDRSSRSATAAILIGSVVMALGSKPSAVVLPAILLIVDWAVITGGLRETLRQRGPMHLAAWACLSVLFATGAVGSLWRSDGIAGVGFTQAGSTPFDYAVSQLSAAAVYARILVDPSVMSIDHGPEALQGTWTRPVGVTLILTFVGLAIGGLARHRWWWCLPATTLLVMIPTSSIVPLADPLADHRLHLALLPVIVALVALCRYALGRLPANASRPAGVVLAIVFVAVLAAEAEGVRRRNADYADPRRLWDDVVARRPEHVRGLVNRASVALREDRYADAERDLRAAADLQPGNPVVIMNLAVLDLRGGRPEEALRALDVVGAVGREDPLFHAARADAFRDLGRCEEAVEACEASLRIEPGNVRTRIVMGNALAECGRLAEAAAVFRNAAETARDPVLRASARFNEGNMHFIEDRMADAIVAYEAAVAADPSHLRAAQGLEEARRRER
ncbi:MAG: tetratricopeptide repeat protein [Phycisphaerales bacterium]|nr:tetratricopeptide repeat protein [Phycisphaerales bacterium]